jgi:hypothetical protein
LPEGFAELEPFVERWALPGASQRMQRRLESEPKEREALFAVGAPLVPAALELLDSKPLNALNEEEERLMNLVLSLTHVAQAVEIQGDDEAFHARGARHVTITRASSDDNPAT